MVWLDPRYDSGLKSLILRKTRWGKNLNIGEKLTERC